MGGSTAWKATLRAETVTVTLVALGEDIYFFETHRFPFSDTLRALGLHLTSIPGRSSEA